VSETAAFRFDAALGVLSLVLLGYAIFAVVLCVRRSLVRERAAAARTFWGSVLVTMLASFAIPFAVVMVADPRSPLPEAADAPSAKARMLAESISEGMNFTVPAALALLVALAVWVVAVVAGSRSPPE
jgi:hypothetical protein